MNPNLTHICQRMRKEVRYSALNTMAMRMLKKHKIYAFSQQAAKKAQIKSQKNFSIIALRLAILHGKLTKDDNQSNADAANIIGSCMKQNLKQVLRSKFMKKSQKNSQLFLEIAYTINLKDIEIIEKVLRTDMNDPALLINLLSGLFQNGLNAHHDSSQLRALHNLAEIFCRYGGEAAAGVENLKNLQLASTGLDGDEPCFNQRQQEPIQNPIDGLGTWPNHEAEIEEILSGTIPQSYTLFQNLSDFCNQGCFYNI